DPLALQREPVRQAVDDDVVLARLLQRERLQRHALAVEAHDILADLQAQLARGEDLFERERPADVGAEGQTDLAGDFGHGGAGAALCPPGRAGQTATALSGARGSVSYSYTIHNGPGNRNDSPSRRRSRQFSQLWPSLASRKRTAMPVSCSRGTSERF